MAKIQDNRSTVNLHLLETQKLKNEEIVALIAFLCSSDPIIPFVKHVNVLRSKYDMTIELRSIDIEVLSLRQDFPLSALRNYYIAANHGYHSLILDTVRGYQSEVNAIVYIRRLEQVFGVQPDYEFIKDLIDFIDTSNMDGPGAVGIRRHYRDILDKISPYQPIPKYIKNFNINIDTLPKLKAKATATMPIKNIVDFLLDNMTDLDLYIEETDEVKARDVLTQRITKMTPIQRENFLHLFKVDTNDVKKIRGDKDVFRIFGPVNFYPETDFSTLTTEDGEPDANVIYGGARMFTDVSMEYDYENDLPMDDWFVGYCLQCSNRIRARFHAVREPVLTGGWRGCFCTMDCVRKYIEVDTIHDPDLYNIYMMKIALTKEFETELKGVGIQDRDYKGKQTIDLISTLPKVDFMSTNLPTLTITTDYGKTTS